MDNSVNRSTHFSELSFRELRTKYNLSNAILYILQEK